MATDHTWTKHHEINARCKMCHRSKEHVSLAIKTLITNTAHGTWEYKVVQISVSSQLVRLFTQNRMFLGQKYAEHTFSVFTDWLVSAVCDILWLDCLACCYGSWHHCGCASLPLKHATAQFSSINHNPMRISLIITLSARAHSCSERKAPYDRACPSVVLNNESLNKEGEGNRLLFILSLLLVDN